MREEITDWERKDGMEEGVEREGESRKFLLIVKPNPLILYLHRCLF